MLKNYSLMKISMEDYYLLMIIFCKMFDNKNNYVERSRLKDQDMIVMMCIAKLLALATLGKVLAKLVLTTFCNVY